jgi:hypothetical protein
MIMRAREDAFNQFTFTAPCGGSYDRGFMHRMGTLRQAKPPHQALGWTTANDASNQTRQLCHPARRRAYGWIT